jgi:glycosyltransferase involved in cell wall biosynthesis
MTVLFVGPLPEPTTGQSLACQVFLEALEKTEVVEIVNLSKPTFIQGANSLGRSFQVLSIIWRVWLAHWRARLIYFTPSESFAGNVKDLLIYAACWPRLRRMVIHLHGGAGMREIMRGKYPLLRALNAYVFRRLGGVIVLGERHVDIFAPAVDPVRIHVAANFAEEEVFVTSTDIETKFTNPACIRLLFLSNLLPGKGHEELVAGFKALKPGERAQLQLDFAGGFESPAAQQAFQRSIEDTPQIRYHGLVRGKAKVDLFSRAHAFALPTYYPYEGQPISILEAYASGAMVITTDHSGIFDIFQDGVNGLAVKRQDAGDISRVLRDILSASVDIKGMALENLRAANAHYRVQHYQRRLLNILAGINDSTP